MLKGGETEQRVLLRCDDHARAREGQRERETSLVEFPLLSSVMIFPLSNISSFSHSCFSLSLFLSLTNTVNLCHNLLPISLLCLSSLVSVKHSNSLSFSFSHPFLSLFHCLTDCWLYDQVVFPSVFSLHPLFLPSSFRLNRGCRLTLLV